MSEIDHDPLQPSGAARNRRETDATAGGDDASLYDTVPSEEKAEAAEEKAQSGAGLSQPSAPPSPIPPAGSRRP